MKRVSVTKMEDVVNGYAILEFDTISTPGYDPGDPSDTTHYLRLVIFDSQEELKKDIAERTNPKRYGKSNDFVVLDLKKLDFKTEVVVNFK